MARYDAWLSGATDHDLVHVLENGETQRKRLVWDVIDSLLKAAVSLGQTGEQAATKVDALFSTFAAEWAIYILTGASAIVTAIQNDVTLGWLDTDVAGTSIRQRLINRLD